jgi:DNA-binding NarL/FixJ family response regulator
MMGANSQLIRILAVDDHPLLRGGIATLVNAEPDMKLVAEASNGYEAIEQFRLHRPDVTLMDLQMPHFNGVDAIERIRREFADARIVVLTTYTGDVQVLRALKAGAQAYNSSKPSVRCTPGRNGYRPKSQRTSPSTQRMTLSRHEK